MERYTRKSAKLLLALREPKRFKELVEETGLSDVGLIKALKRFIERGLIEKLPDGKYILTEEGRKLAEELEVYEFVREILARHGVGELKASLELVIKLDRMQRVVVLINLLKILMYIRFRHYNSEIILSESIIPQLNYLISITHEHLRELGIDPYNYSPDLRNYIVKDLSRRPEKPDLSSLSCDNIIPSITNRNVIQQRVSALKNKIEKLNSYIDFIKGLEKSIKLDSLTPEERRLITDASQIIEEYYRTAEELVKKYKRELRKCKKKLDEIKEKLNRIRDAEIEESNPYLLVTFDAEKEEKESEDSKSSYSLARALFGEGAWW